MSVRVAKSAGFCFGVSRAVDTVEACVSDGQKTVTLGPIIHNRHVVDTAMLEKYTGETVHIGEKRTKKNY